MTLRQSHTPCFKIAYHPSPVASPIPKVVREVGAEDPVQQIVKLFVPSALEFGDIDTDLLGARGKICRCAQWNNRRL